MRNTNCKGKVEKSSRRLLPRSRWSRGAADAPRAKIERHRHEFDRPCGPRARPMGWGRKRDQERAKKKVGNTLK